MTKGSSDTLENQATGIEAASYYDGDTDTQYTFGLNFQIPGTVTGLAYYFKIGAAQPFAIQYLQISMLSFLYLKFHYLTSKVFE